MATGLAIPIQVQRGRAVRSTGEEQLRKIIVLSLSDCASDNPFQDLGIGIQAIFDVQGPTVRFDIERRVKEVFRRLERQGRAKLSPGYPRFEVNPAHMELLVNIKYINLETMMDSEWFISYGGALTGGPVQV